MLYYFSSTWYFHHSFNVTQFQSFYLYISINIGEWWTSFSIIHHSHTFAHWTNRKCNWMQFIHSQLNRTNSFVDINRIVQNENKRTDNWMCVVFHVRCLFVCVCVFDWLRNFHDCDVFLWLLNVSNESVIWMDIWFELQIVLNVCMLSVVLSYIAVTCSQQFSSK